MANPTELTTADLVSEGLLNPGPLAPAIEKDPEKSAKNIREFVNPFPYSGSPIDPLKALGFVHKTAGKALSYPAAALNFLNPASGMMTPEQTALRSQTLGNQFRDIGEAALVPWAQGKPLLNAFLTRLGQSAMLAGTQQAAEGKGPGEIFGAAAVATAFQGGLESVAALPRMLINTVVGRRILSGAAANFQKALKSFDARKQFDQEFVDSLNELRMQGFQADANKASAEYAMKAYNYKVEGQKGVQQWEQQVAQQHALQEQAKAGHAERVAQNILKTWDQRVPAWRGMPQTTEGLIDRVYGTGQEKVSASFQKSLTDVIDKAKGKTVPLAQADADALGLATGGGATSGMPPGIVAPGSISISQSGLVRVDAAELAQTLYGNKSKIDPDLYHAGANALVQAGLGNGAANAEYSAAMGLKRFMDKTQALEYLDKPTLDVERLLKGLTKEKVLKELQGRTGDDALRGAIAESRTGLPQEPPEIPKPVQAPLEPKPQKAVAPAKVQYDPTIQAPVEQTEADLGLKSVTLPSPGKASLIGGGLGALIGNLAGGGGSHYGVGGLTGATAGALLSHLLPKLYTQAPLTARTEKALAVTPSMAAQLLRALFTQDVPPPDVMADETPTRGNAGSLADQLRSRAE